MSFMRMEKKAPELVQSLNKRCGGAVWLSAAVFLLPPLALWLLELQANGEIGQLTSDAELYLSIADNALKAGHFIQTARDVEGFVVPPVVPFALLVLRFLGFKGTAIAVVHALLFGTSCLLLFRTGRRLFGRAGILAPIVYAVAYLRCRLYLGNIFVEHWYLFLLCLIVWLLFREMEEEKRAVWLPLCCLAAFLTRPSLALVFLAGLLYSVVFSFRNRKARPAILLLLVSLLAFSACLLVSHRETGEWILLENYSGRDLYLATSPDARVTRAEEISDPVLFEIEGDKTLTMSQRSTVLKALAKKNLRSDPVGYGRKVLLRALELYGRCWFFLPVLAFLGGLCFAKGRKPGEGWIPLVIGLLLAVLSCMGMPELRYTMPIWPLACLHCAALLPVALRKKVPE